MKYLEYAPSSHLAPFIKCYWSLSNSSGVRREDPKQFLTEGGMELVFNLGDPFTVISGHSVFENHGGAFAIGPMTKSQYGYAGGNCHLFGVCFLPGAATSSLSLPMRELSDRCIDAKDLWGSKVKRLADYFCDRPDDAQSKLDILNRFFESQIDWASPEYQLLSSSMQLIRQSNGRLPIELLAHQLTIRRRRLERIFQKMVGIPPKKMSRLFRIKNAISRILDPSFDGWAGLAIDAGYFDQAHFIRDFKMVTGLTPSSCKDFRIDLAMLSQFKPIEIDNIANQLN